MCTCAITHNAGEFSKRCCYRDAGIVPLLRTQQMLAGTMVDGILASLGLFYYPIKNKTKQNKTKQKKNKTKQNKTKQNKTKQNRTEKRENSDISFSKSFVPTPASGFSLSLTGADEERLGKGVASFAVCKKCFLENATDASRKKG